MVRRLSDSSPACASFPWRQRQPELDLQTSGIDSRLQQIPDPPDLPSETQQACGTGARDGGGPASFGKRRRADADCPVQGCQCSAISLFSQMNRYHVAQQTESHNRIRIFDGKAFRQQSPSVIDIAMVQAEIGQISANWPVDFRQTLRPGQIQCLPIIPDGADEAPLQTSETGLLLPQDRLLARVPAALFGAILRGGQWLETFLHPCLRLRTAV